VEAAWTRGLADWIGAHTRAFAAIGGVPRLIVPDNAKVAVIKACLYEPKVNRTYAEMAAHYGTAVLPTRPRRPRDKAKAEAGYRFYALYDKISGARFIKRAPAGEVLATKLSPEVLDRRGAADRNCPFRPEQRDRIPPAKRPEPCGAAHQHHVEHRIRKLGHMGRST
jgi:hypothetical protein